MVAVWFVGFVLLSTIWLRRFVRVSMLRKRGIPIQIDGCPIPAISLLESIEPGVFGIHRPVLFLPAGILDRLTRPQLAAVIEHELSHVRRKDNLTSAIHMCVQSIFWFHPLVWWLGYRLIDERERACDEAVLAFGGPPRDYAEGILNVCKLYAASPVSCVAGVSGSNLKKRIERIMTCSAVLRLSIAGKAAIAIVTALTLITPITIGMLSAPGVVAQTRNAAIPGFEVASIKPCRVEYGRLRGGGDSSPGRMSTGCDLLVDDNNLGLIQRAYVRFSWGHTNPLGVLPVKGGPKWIHSDMYRIDATASGHPSAEMMMGPMLQALLEDRFKLKIRRETKEGPVYALTLAGGSPRLKPSVEGACVQMPLTFPVPKPPSGQRFCRDLISLLNPSVEAEGSTVSEFSKLLNLVLDRPVIDKTGLNGTFDIRLEFARDAATPGLRTPGALLNAPAQPSADPGKPTIFTAIREQLGLKLTPATGPVERLVIDHIERPSKN
jgi:uncharacterized protein (TIGR03435 family)